MGLVGENCDCKGTSWMGTKKHFFVLKIPCRKMFIEIDNFFEPLD
jgi:hypothetical protein